MHRTLISCREALSSHARQAGGLAGHDPLHGAGCWAILLCCLCLFGRFAQAGEVVINEIMFHPPSHLIQDEFVELHNRGTNHVDLLGWKLDRGVSFTFSNSLVIPPGAFVVIAADTAAFAQQHPSIAPIAGGWSGSLANSGETIRLVDSQGTTSDEVRYADSGDFAIRYESFFTSGQSWTYFSSADGSGPSLERVSPEQSGLVGANWGASSGPGGTPGAANSRLLVLVAPLLSELEHAPAVPRSTDPVTITVRVQGSAAPPKSVSLFYRVVSVAKPAAFAEIPMVDDGSQNDGVAHDGRYGVVLPEMANRSVVEFYAQVTSVEGLVRTYPPPALDRFGVQGQYVNALYLVDNSSYTGTQPLYYVVLSETDRASLANLPQVDPTSDVELHASFISVEGAESEIRYGCSVRLRGASSRFMNPPNYRVSIPSDRRWKGVTGLNLNLVSVHSQIAGHALATRAGLVTEEHRPAQVRVNGVNLATTAVPPLGVYAHAEVPDSDFAAHHFPEDPDGNLYRASSRGHSATLDSLGSDPNRYRNVGYSKTTHQSEDDWTDLIHLTEVLANPDEGSYLTELSRAVNIPQWLTYFSVFLLSGSTETSLGTGVGDDFAMYRGVRDPRFQLIGHDWDSILGEGGSAPADIFVTAEVPAIDRFLKHQQIAPLYYGEILKQLQGAFAPASVARVLDENLSGWTPSTAIGNMKRYATNRAATILGQIPTELKWRGGTSFQGSGFVPRFNTNTILTWGNSHAEKTRSVLVNGVASRWSAWTARWTNTVRLNYGFNSLLVQSLDQSGVEFERTNAVVWVNAPPGNRPSLTGTLTADRTLDAVSGPYLVSNVWTIPTGTTLRIEPGATLIFSPESRLVVEGTLEALGTPSQPVFLSKDPAEVQTDRWGGIFINAGDRTQRLSNVFLIGAGSTGASLRATNSILEIDHLIVAGTRQTSLDLEDCSLRLTDSVFPSDAIAETFKGRGIRPAGEMFIARNLFPRTASAIDVLRFGGGHRPGPILQLYGNDFLGGGDDLVELSDADAHLEANLFARAKRAGSVPEDLAAAVSITGNGNLAPTTSVTLVRNTFVLCDYGVLSRNGARFVAQNNSFNGLEGAAVSFDEPERRPQGITPGAGAQFTGNIVWRTPTNFLHVYREDPINGSTDLQVTANLLSGEDIPSDATRTLREDPRFIDPRSTSVLATALRRSVQLLPGSPALQAGWDGRDLGAHIPAGLAIAGIPAEISPVRAALIRISGAGYVQYRYRLNEGVLSPAFGIALPIQLTDLPPGTNQLRVIGQNSAGIWDVVETESKPWQVAPALTRVVLNELLARNATAFSHEGTHPDAIELYNAGGNAVSLDGFGLTDDPAQPHRFTFPSGTSLGQGAYLVVYADSRSGPDLHTGFGLQAEGGRLLLYEAGGTNAALLDQISYGPQIQDYSIGRLTGGNWGLTSPTLGEANQPVRLGDPTRVVINEWLAAGIGDDFIELFNLDPLPVDLGGLVLTDDSIAYPTRHRIAPLSFIGGSGLQVFTADGKENTGPSHLNFKLSADGGLISLHASNGLVIDCFLYQSQRTDVSQGRSPNGAARISFFTEPTPGAPNPAVAPPLNRVIVNYTTNLISSTNQLWRYRQDDVDLLAGWRQVDYDDSGWLLAPGPFGIEDCECLPEPIRTPLSLARPDGAGQVRTYYFRTTFTLPPLFSSNSTFSAGLVYDDGAAVYVNGRLAARQGLPVNYNHNTFASAPSSPEGRLLNLPLAASNFVAGVNFIAVELHQSDATSDDAVLSLSLRADRSVTNFLSTQKVLLNEILARNLGVTNTDGSVTDWAEVYNPSPTNATDLSGMSLSDSAANPRRWIFPAGSILAAGGYRVIRLDGGRPASTADEPELNTGFGLDADGDRLLLFDAPAAGGGLLDGITFGIQAADLSIGRASTAGPFWELNVPTPGGPNLTAPLENPAGLRINEWMASPTSGDDWFELHNPMILPVALEGLYLTDDPSQRTQSRIPALSFIGTGARGGYVQFHADGATDKGPSHVAFKLAANGESIGLYGSDGASTLDLVTFSKQATGISEGRLPDGAPVITRFPRSASPGSQNTLPFTDVVINEVLTRPEGGAGIELRNTTEYPQHIGGWWLSTDAQNPLQYRIPDHTILSPTNMLTFTADQLRTSDAPGVGLFLISGQIQTVYLTAVTNGGVFTGLRTQLRAGVSDVGVSSGPVDTSTGTDATLLISSTLGSSNTAPRVGPLVLNEIHYHPKAAATGVESDEFVELFNTSAAPVALFSALEPTNTWHLRNAVDFDLPPEVTIPGHGFLLIVGFDPGTNATQTASFRTRFNVPASVAVLGPWEGRLDNSGETIELNYPTAPIGIRYPRALADRVSYHDVAPWATGADGQGTGLGNSLQRRDPSAYGNEATNWIAASPTAGRVNSGPSASVPAFTRQPSDQTAAPGENISFVATVNGTAPFVYQWSRNGLDLSDATNSTLSLSSITPDDEGVYSLRASNASGAARSRTARLRLNRPPLINRQPEAQVVVLDHRLVLSLGAQGTAPLSIQWSRDGSPLSGETNAVLTIDRLQLEHLGVYRATVTNRFGKAQSSPALIETETPPHFSEQPQPATLLVNEGQRAVLTARVAGSAPLRFQWRRNGQPVRNATNENLVLPNPHLEDSGLYTLLAANTAGSAVSANARIQVRVAPTLVLSNSFVTLEEQGEPNAEFLIRRSGTNDIPINVELEWSGTATPGVDYAPPPSSLTLPPGTDSLVVSVKLIDDGLREPLEQILLSLKSSPDYQIGSNRTASVFINDNENRPPFLIGIQPENGLHYPLSPTNLVFELDAVDPDEGDGVTNVVLIANQKVILGNWTAPPFVAIWTNPPAGSNSILAYAVDKLGAFGVSNLFSFYVNQPPRAQVLQPQEGEFYNPGTPAIQVSASGSDSDGQIRSMSFLLGTNLIAVVTNSPYSLSLTNLPTGLYMLTAIATDNEGQPSVAAERRFSVGVRSESFTDAFRLRGLIVGTNFSLSAENRTATSESGEPQPLFDSGSRGSIWIEWIPTADGICRIDTRGSRNQSGDGLDTVLAVYIGTTLTGLWEYISDDDGAIPGAGDSGPSEVQFGCEAGVAYQIRISSYGGGTPRMNLSVTPEKPALIPGDAVDAPELPWRTRSSALWVSQKATTSDGVDALRMPTPVDRTSYWVETTVEGPALLSFRWRMRGINVSFGSMTIRDRFLARLNSAPVLELNRQATWTADTLVIPPGPQKVRWTYLTAIGAGDTSIREAFLDQVKVLRTRLASVQLTPPSSADLSIEGASGSSFTLESSEDLVKWLVIGSGKFDTNGLSVLSLTNLVPGQPKQFFRSRQLP